MNTSIFLTIFYGDLHDEVVELIKKKAVLEVSRGDPVKLEDSLFITTRQNRTEKTLSFTIRKAFQCRMDPHIFWTPFEILNMILTVNLRPITGEAQGKRFALKFNFMDHPHLDLKISYTEDGTFGQHDLAESLLAVEYSNKRIPAYEVNELEKEEKKKQKKRAKLKKQGKDLEMMEK